MCGSCVYQSPSRHFLSVPVHHFCNCFSRVLAFLRAPLLLQKRVGTPLLLCKGLAHLCCFATEGWHTSAASKEGWRTSAASKEGWRTSAASKEGWHTSAASKEGWCTFKPLESIRFEVGFMWNICLLKLLQCKGSYGARHPTW